MGVNGTAAFIIECRSRATSRQAVSSGSGDLGSGVEGPPEPF